MAKRKQSTFEQLTNGKVNRKERKEFLRRLRSDDPVRGHLVAAGGEESQKEFDRSFFLLIIYYSVTT
jgi:hypothetical protein